jgi:hypothetical protein
VFTHITTYMLTEPLERPLCIEGSDDFVASAAASIVTGWNEPVPGRDYTPLKSTVFSRRTI